MRFFLLILSTLSLLLSNLPVEEGIPAPDPSLYCLDEAHVLSEDTIEEILSSNDRLCDACGAQIVVVTVKTTGEMPIDEYAVRLFNEWGIGDAKKNNGFLLLMAIDDEDYYALPGDGLYNELSAEVLTSCFDQYLEADFARGDYDAGARRFFEEIHDRIARFYGVDVSAAQEAELSGRNFFNQLPSMSEEVTR